MLELGSGAKDQNPGGVNAAMRHNAYWAIRLHESTDFLSRGSLCDHTSVLDLLRPRPRPPFPYKGCFCLSVLGSRICGSNTLWRFAAVILPSCMPIGHTANKEGWGLA